MAIKVTVRERANVKVASRSRSAVNVSQRTGGGGGSVKLTPTVEIDGSNVLFHFVTLAQMEKMHVRAEGVSMIGFALVKGENDFELRFSSDSPQEIAGNLIFDDSIDIVDDVFETITIPLEGYVVSGVYLDGVDANLLEADINWRLSDIQRSQTTMRESYNQISAAAEAYNVGKRQLAQNIASKGVEASASETLPELAEKVIAISQETYEINGGEMYAKQLFGSLETPNYWNLYEVLAQLLSDGRLVQYGGILLAEYYCGYDSLALSGAGAGGAYVVSDLDENGQFKLYHEDTTHVWATEFDGKGNRWVAYCFADAGHDFQIMDTNTSPRGIFIGRKVGTITNFANGLHSQLVVSDNNTLYRFNQNGYTNTWSQNVVIRNIEDSNGLFDNATNIKSAYVSVKNLNRLFYTRGTSLSLETLICKADTASGNLFDLTGNAGMFNNIQTIVLDIQSGSISLIRYGTYAPLNGLKNLYISGNFTLNCDSANSCIPATAIIHLLYTGNAKDGGYLTLDYYYYNGYNSVTDLRLKDGWCKDVNVSPCISLTEENMYAHILQRLKQDEPDCGDGVTITLGSNNIAKLTSEESVQLLDDLTNIYGYTFA